MTRLGAPELLLILGIVILIFGVGRLGRIGSELGSAIRNFREGLGNNDDKGKKDDIAAAEPKPQEKS
ncbi:MAG: twin-arginine translocase TatA/TatE family subunit [Anaerolineales bacterium]|nr:twin-arginine translocase TatA/TatE family subunit [Anaerolineales bacterium]